MTQPGVLHGGIRDGDVVPVPDGEAYVTITEDLPRDPLLPPHEATPTVQIIYRAEMVNGELDRDEYGRLRLVRQN